MAVKNRLGSLETVLTGRSACPKCKKRLKAIDLVPVISYLTLRGCCRYCKKPIGLSYLLVELICAALGGFVVWKFGLHFSSFSLFISLSLLVLAGFLDIESHEVDLWIFIAGVLFALLFQGMGVSSWQDMVTVLLGGTSALIIPAAFYLLSRERWMGLGDVAFAFWIGIIASYPASLIAIFSAFLLGGIFGIIVLVTKGKRAQRRIPFGPFLGLGGVIGLLWGQRILDLYLKLIGL